MIGAADDRSSQPAFFVVLLYIPGAGMPVIPRRSQTAFAHTARLAAIALSRSGMTMLLMMLVTGFITGRVEPRYLRGMGLALEPAPCATCPQLRRRLSETWRSNAVVPLTAVRCACG
jgi:hypothetical protein